MLFRSSRFTAKPKHSTGLGKLPNWRPTRQDASAAEESGYHLTGMPSLRVQIVRFGDAHQPGVVECQFRAADGQMHSIIDKLPIFTDAVLSSDSQYPQPGAVRCQVLGQVSADGAVRITFVESDHV